MSRSEKNIYIDPPSKDFGQDKLFDLKDSILNRDGTLLPFHRLRLDLQSQGAVLRTADYVFAEDARTTGGDYYSLGILSNYQALIRRKDIKLRAFVVLEPPVTAPHIYQSLPQLTQHFERVYLYNTVGEGYSLQDVDQSKLHTIHWPQPYKTVQEPFWSNNDRLNRVVMINGNHRPRSRDGELYSKRIEALVYMRNIDLYGRGWTKWLSKESIWFPYWKNRKRILSVYHGECSSKSEVLSRYRFCLCFENMAMQGYVTEKIFDCLYSGCIPIYWGAGNIQDIVPSEAYIDFRNFYSYDDLSKYIEKLTDNQCYEMRNVGRSFINSIEFSNYFNSLESVFSC